MSRKILFVLLLILFAVIVMVSSRSGSVDIAFFKWTLLRMDTPFALLAATAWGVIIGILLK